MELNSRNLGSWCEAVIAVLQGLMSSEVESAGGVTGDVTGSELAEVCQQSHVSVMGCNTLRGLAPCQHQGVIHECDNIFSIARVVDVHHICIVKL